MLGGAVLGSSSDGGTAGPVSGSAGAGAAGVVAPAGAVASAATGGALGADVSVGAEDSGATDVAAGSSSCGCGVCDSRGGTAGAADFLPNNRAKNPGFFSGAGAGVGAGVLLSVGGMLFPR